MKPRLLKSYVISKPVITQFVHIPGNGKLSFTTDNWTSPHNKAIMALTATMLTVDFTMHELLLAFRELFGKHSGANIFSLFMDVVKEFKLENRVSTQSPYNFKFIL